MGRNSQIFLKKNLSKNSDGALTLKVHVKYGDHLNGKVPHLKYDFKKFVRSFLNATSWANIIKLFTSVI
jgi:hypothetical protein